METLHFQGTDGTVNWQGICLEGTQDYTNFIKTEVSARLLDQEGSNTFKADLRGLASTGFQHANLDAIFAAEVTEQRDWAVGEAFAEAWLTKKHGAVWPWNLERDKRTPKASLPGADLVGFMKINNETRLLIGEVKTSSDENTPPNVMSGRGGLTHQLEELATNLILLNQLLRWLHSRCKNTAYETQFNEAVVLLLNSNNKSVAIFGILIRDTKPNEKDISSRAKALAKKVEAPTDCQLFALYLPHPISIFPSITSSGVQS